MSVDRVRFEDGKAANWEAKNPILGLDILGRESDSGLFKLGDGVTRWNDLPYKDVTSSTSAIGLLITSATTKETPDDADIVGFVDSATSILKKLTWTNIKSFFKTYFDTIYAPYELDGGDPTSTYDLTETDGGTP